MSKPQALILPNPFTPLAWLPPTIAEQIQILNYTTAVTLGIYLWDIAVNLGNDYQLLFKQKIRYQTVIYYLSRIFTLAFVLSSFILEVAHLSSCQTGAYMIGVFLGLAQTTTSLLFILRVTALYKGNKIIMIIFALFWLTFLGFAVAIPIGLRALRIGSTGACISSGIPNYVEGELWVVMIHDTLVFALVTYKILSFAVIQDGRQAQVRAFFGSGYIPRFSRTLLKSGQHYYFLTICINTVTLALVKAPGVPIVYRAICIVPVMALTNAMACVVFRRVKFGLITEDGTVLDHHQTVSTFHAAGNGHENSLPLHLNRNSTHTGLQASSNLASDFVVDDIIELRISKSTVESKMGSEKQL
ncbi:hypothetical protein K435DRAFT_773018 [Dendrothele bispora CBS 962.96]|uniref:Transmembrane protein n=1 Tax=Dendrothele bispora (strain CBS 962.96) TaxID=1314807 RepID=A0A4S8MTZ1_DENBC|nr:hypothetical protein K435DRAFT_773018 [Dendrothele bispora CBS 962.96]